MSSSQVTRFFSTLPVQQKPVLSVSSRSTCALTWPRRDLSRIFSNSWFMKGSSNQIATLSEVRVVLDTVSFPCLPIQGDCTESELFLDHSAVRGILKHVHVKTFLRRTTDRKNGTHSSPMSSTKSVLLQRATTWRFLVSPLAATQRTVDAARDQKIQE